MDGFETGFVPPLPKGTRVVATAAAEMVDEGTTGTITWHHPFPEMPYRVKWDVPGWEKRVHIGMSDIGDLTRPDEIKEATL